MIFQPYEYQQRAIQWILDKPRCGLFLDMGLGKTVITLTALQRLMDLCEVSKVLVVAPKKVAEVTWSDECLKWRHLRGLRVVKVLGTEKQRLAALNTDADIYVTGRDNFLWLVEHYKLRLPFDTLVIDELTSFKSASSKRFRAMKRVSPLFRHVVGLTGTPAPNGLQDLWAQMYCIDLGDRLGKSLTRYRDTYFYLQKWNHIVVRCSLKEAAEGAIRGKIADVCLSMQAKDYLQLPSLRILSESVDMGDSLLRSYRKFERDKVMNFMAEKPEEAMIANSAAALMNKLSQFANGAIYDDEKKAHEIHSEKLSRLCEIIEAAGEPVLVFYQFRHDIPRILDSLKGYRARVYTDDNDLRDWNKGDIDVLLAHPASTAYGLNMQRGGHIIVWFGTGWNLELYQQANARLHRQGQTRPVFVYNLVCKGTVDETMVGALEAKKSVQQALLDALGDLKTKHGL